MSLFSASRVAPIVKNFPAMIEDLGSIPGSGRSPGGGHGNPVQYACLGESPCTEESSGGYSQVGLTESDATELKHRCVFFNSGGFGEGQAVTV